MIEEHDELSIMLGAKPSYVRDVIHYLRNQLQINEDKVAALEVDAWWRNHIPQQGDRRLVISD